MFIFDSYHKLITISFKREPKYLLIIKNIENGEI